MPDSRDKLYSAISSKYDLGTIDDFRTKMDNPDSRKKLYEAVSKDFDLGSFEDFENKIGEVPKKKVQPTTLSPDGVTPSAKPTATGTNPVDQLEEHLGKSNPAGRVDLYENALGKIGKRLSDAVTAYKAAKASGDQQALAQITAQIKADREKYITFERGVVGQKKLAQMKNPDTLGNHLAIGIEQALGTIAMAPKGINESLNAIGSDVAEGVAGLAGKTMAKIGVDTTGMAKQLEDLHNFTQEHKNADPLGVVSDKVAVIGKHILDKASENSQEIRLRQAHHGSGFEAIKSGDIGNAVKFGVQSMLESLPSSLTYLNPVTAAVSSAGMVGQELQTAEDEGRDVNSGTVAAGTIKAALEFVSERMFGSGKASLDLIKKLGKEGAEQFVKETTTNVIKESLAKKLGKMYSEEIVGEMANQMGDNAVDKYINGKKDVKLWDGVGDAGWTALFSAIGQGTPSVVVQHVIDKKQVAEAVQKKEQAASMIDEAMNQENPVVAATVADQAHKLHDEGDAVILKQNEIGANANPETMAKIDENHARIAAIATTLQADVKEDTKLTLAQEQTRLEEELVKLGEKATDEAKTNIKKKKAEEEKANKLAVKTLLSEDKAKAEDLQHSSNALLTSNENGTPEEKGTVQDKGVISPDELDHENNIRDMMPLADEMVKAEIAINNAGYEIRKDYDEVVVLDKKSGELQDAEDLPKNILKLAADWEDAHARMERKDSGAIEEALKRVRGEEVTAEDVTTKKIASNSNTENDGKTKDETKDGQTEKVNPESPAGGEVEITPTVEKLREELKAAKTTVEKKKIQKKIDAAVKIEKLQKRENRRKSLKKSSNFEPVTEADHVEEGAYGISEDSIAKLLGFKPKQDKNGNPILNEKGQMVYPDMPRLAYARGRVLKSGGREITDIAADMIREGKQFEIADEAKLAQQIAEHAVQYPGGLKEYISKTRGKDAQLLKNIEEESQAMEDAIPEDATDEQLAEFDNEVQQLDEIDDFDSEAALAEWDAMFNKNEDEKQNGEPIASSEEDGSKKEGDQKNSGKSVQKGKSSEEVKSELPASQKEMVESATPMSDEEITTTAKAETAGIVNSKLIPVKEALQALFKGMNYVDAIIAKQVNSVENWVADQVKKGLIAENTILRNVSSFLTSYGNGLPRTEKETADKRHLTGGIKKAQYDMAKQIQDLHALVGNDVAALARVHEALDPEFYKDFQPSLAQQGWKPATYADLTDTEKKLYDIIRKSLDYVHNYNFAMGFIDQKTYDKFKGNYTPRMYEQFEVPEEVQGQIDEVYNGIGKSKRLDFSIFKMRKEVTKAMQEAILQDPVYAMAKRMMQTEVNATIRTYLHNIETIGKGLISPEAKAGFTKLEGRGYGPLNGKYVVNYIAEDLKGYFFANKMMDLAYDIGKVYDKNKVRQWFKKYRTVLSPTVQLGNFTSNFVFAHIAGIDPITFGGNMIKANKELDKKGPVYDLLLKEGIIDSNDLSQDLRPLVANTPTDKPKTLLGKGLAKLDEFASNLYAKTDNAAKVAAYMSFREQGLDEKQAIQRVYESFQNYATVGKIWDFAAKTPIIGNPFVKFQADLQRILKNAALKRPLTTASYVGVIYAMAQLSSAWSGEDEDKKRIRENRPFIPKIKLGITDVPLTFQTPIGEMNLARYLSPYYIYDLGGSEDPIESWSKMLPYKIRVSNNEQKGNRAISLDPSDPLMGVYYAAFMSDRDFRNKSISDPTSTKWQSSGIGTDEKLLNSINYVLRSQLPYYDSAQDMYLALSGGEDFYGRQKNGWQALVGSLVKMQQFGESQYLKVITNKVNSMQYDMDNLEQLGKDSWAITEKNKQDKYELFKAGGISKDAYDKFVVSEDEKRKERVAKIVDEMAKKQSEFNKFIEENKNYLP